jgi:hypothetical protein
MKEILIILKEITKCDCSCKVVRIYLKAQELCLKPVKTILSYHSQPTNIDRKTREQFAPTCKCVCGCVLVTVMFAYPKEVDDK